MGEPPSPPGCDFLGFLENYLESTEMAVNFFRQFFKYNNVFKITFPQVYVTQYFQHCLSSYKPVTFHNCVHINVIQN